MGNLIVRPDRYRQLGSGKGCHFVLATNAGREGNFTIEADDSYDSSVVVGFDGDFERFLAEKVPQAAHVLVISPDQVFRSPANDLIGPRRKLMAMACNTTPYSSEAIAHYLNALERSDPEAQEVLVDRFFAVVDSAERLEVLDDAYGTRATFEHRHEDYSWIEQAGFIEWGAQQVAPAGVITVIPMEMFSFNASRRLAVNGEIALRGQAIVHSWREAHLEEEQSRLYEQLTALDSHAVICTVEDGSITQLRATHPAAEKAVDALEGMFRQDERYRIIWEFGFAFNTDFELYNGNMAMNEIYGGQNGVVRWGIGLLPYTPHAPIFLCPGSRIVGGDDQPSLGAPPAERKRPRMARRKVAGCPCHWFAATCEAAKELERGQTR